MEIISSIINSSIIKFVPGLAKYMIGRRGEKQKIRNNIFQGTRRIEDRFDDARARIYYVSPGESEKQRLEKLTGGVWEEINSQEPLISKVAIVRGLDPNLLLKPLWRCAGQLEHSQRRYINCDRVQLSESDLADVFGTGNDASKLSVQIRAASDNIRDLVS